MTAGAVKLECVAQDGVRVRASAGAASFRRKASLQDNLELARARVRELKEQIVHALMDGPMGFNDLARAIGLKIRYADFRTVTRDFTAPQPTRDPALIRRHAGECLRRVPLDQRLRLLGVRAGSLHREGELPPPGVAEPGPPAQASLPLFGDG